MGESHDEDFLVKKMEEMRKKNEEILKRHQEIEQDKMYADQFSNNAKERRKTMDLDKVPRATTVRTPRTRGPPPEPQLVNYTQESDEKRHHRFSESDGPPPDPNYNFLSDPSRKRNDSSSADNWRSTEKNTGGGWGQSRRHHTNYGGSDFRNVKSTMEKQKSSYRKNQTGFSQNAGDLTMQMTGKQRIQYEVWKKERERVDQARIDRQRSSDGSWRREWDSHKSFGNARSDEEHEQQFENHPNSFQRQKMQTRRSDLNSNTSGYLQRSHDDDDDEEDEHERIPRTGKVFRPSAKSSRLITGGNGSLSITLTSNVKQADLLDRELEKGKLSRRRKCEIESPKAKSSSWTFLVSEPSSPTVPNQSEVPKPLYPGWQTAEGEGLSKSCKQDNVQEVNTRSVNLDQQMESLVVTVPLHKSSTSREFVEREVKNSSDSDIYISEDDNFDTIEVMRSDKAHIQEVTCKLMGLNINECKGDDQKQEDVPKEKGAENIEVVQNDKAHMQEVKCKSMSLNMNKDEEGDDDDEWEDVSEEEGAGNSCG